jgi:Tol biopolymer transport system component
MTWGMRPAAVAGLCLVIAAAAAFLGYRRLWPYPPPDAADWLVVIVGIAGLIGLWAGRRGERATRKRAVVAAVAVAATLPFVATTVAPGIAQPPDHRIPGGRTEVIAAAPDGNFDLYLLPDGDPSKLEALTDTADLTEKYPQLDPTDTTIAYTLQRGDGSTEIHVMQLGQGHIVEGDRTVLAGVPGTLAPTAWAPNGELLVQVQPARGATRVDRLDLTTGHVTTFLRDAGNVAFSPDGTKTAFSAPSNADPQDWDIWVADAEGAHARDVIHTSAEDAFPAWSPDGGVIAFTSWIEGNADVFTADASGGAVRNITAGSADRDTSFGWSEDGHILFLSDRSHTGGVFQYFMNPDGSDIELALRI